MDVQQVPSPEWLTADEVAKELRVHIETVRRWLRDGTLPAISLGSRKGGYRIRRGDLEAFIQQRYGPGKEARAA